MYISLGAGPVRLVRIRTQRAHVDTLCICSTSCNLNVRVCPPSGDGSGIPTLLFPVNFWLAELRATETETETKTTDDKSASNSKNFLQPPQQDLLVNLSHHLLGLTLPPR